MKLFICSVHWNFQQRYASLEEIIQMGKQVTEIYEKISFGKLQLKNEYQIVESERKSLTKLLESIKKENKGFECYVIVHNLVPEGNRAGSRSVFLKSTLVRNCLHELGHVLGLGHSGGDDKKGNYGEYNDKLSFMGRYAVKTLNAPQMFYMGWISGTEKAMENKTYKIIDPYVDGSLPKGLKFSVGDKDYLISYQRGLPRIHSYRKGGTTLLNKEQMDKLIQFEWKAENGHLRIKILKIYNDDLRE